MSLIFFLVFPLSVFPQHTSVTLAPGDNLFRITLKTGVPSPVLKRINQITDETKLKSGQVLKIPSVHSVSPGETLFSLSRRWGIPVDVLRDWNDLKNTSLGAGQKLYYISEIPVTRPASPQPAPNPALNPAPNPESRPRTGSAAESKAPQTAEVPYILPLSLSGEKINDPVSGLKFPLADGPFRSAAHGTVIFQDTTRDLGKILLLEDSQGRIFGYCGFESSPLVVGSTVTQGQSLGQVSKLRGGLMFFIYKDGKPQDIPGSNP